MAGLGDSAGRTAKRILLGLLLFWAMVPVLVIMVFLGWAAVAAEGLWRIPFALGAAGMALVLVRWGAGLVRRTRGDGDDGAATVG